MADWIKIHRSILDSYCFATSDNFKIWTWMLLKANFKRGFIPLKIGKGFITVKVERGQFIFGRNAAEKELKIDGMKVYRVLLKYQELEQVKIDVNSQYSIVTICNYDTYQNKQEPDEQPKNNQRATNEQSMSNGCATDEHKEEELEEKESKEKKGMPNTNGFACYDVEEYILGNQQQFEKICIATSRNQDEVKKELHLYHLWLAKKELYPMGKGAVTAGIESWIHNADTYKKQYNGKSTTSNVGKEIKFDRP